MAFSMNGMSNAFGASTSTEAVTPPPTELQEVSTTKIGFKGLKGDTRARVTKSQWPTDSLPPSYASLLAIASARGIFAAAGPNEVVIGKCSAARNAIYDAAPSHSGRTPPVDLIHSVVRHRPAHVVFSSDESCLVIADQADAEIYAYAIPDLCSGSSDPAIRLSTTGALRSVVANPDPAQGHLFALVTLEAKLLLADLQQNQLVTGNNGRILAENVICVAWSPRGKQLMAGRSDGTAIQLTPAGKVVAEIPKPPDLPSSSQLAQVVWLENNVLFLNYTPYAPDSASDIVSSQYILHTDAKRSQYHWQTCSFDMFYPTVERLPASFLAARLQNYEPKGSREPNLSQVLFIASSIAPEIATITKAVEPFDPETVSAKSTYTITRPADEPRWATMPSLKNDEGGAISDDDTTPLGLAIDLSDDMPILAPVPSDPDIDDSTVPLPELVALDSQGNLVYWAFIYEHALTTDPVITYSGITELEAVRKNINGVDLTYRKSEPTAASTKPSAVSQVANAQNGDHSFTTTDPATVSSPPSQGKSSWTSTGFGETAKPDNASAQVQQSTFGKPAAGAAFGQTGFAQPTALGQPSSFGAPSALGKASIFGQSSGFGQGPAFGQTSPFGQRAALSQPAAPVQAGAGLFSGSGSKTTSGFGSFASASGFGSASKTPTSSAFGSGGGFGGNTNTGSSALNASSSSSFGHAGLVSEKSSSFGNLGSGNSLKIQSSFQKDETSRDAGDDKEDDSSSFSFGKGLGSMLGSQKQASGDENKTQQGLFGQLQKTPPGTIQQKQSTTTPTTASLFGASHQSTTPQTQPKALAGFSWGSTETSSTTPKETPGAMKMMFTTQTAADTPAEVQRSEPWSFGNVSNQQQPEKQTFTDDERSGTGPPAPLPPDPFSKPGYQPGDTSGSSSNSRSLEDAPLPPDFMTGSRTAHKGIETSVSDLPSEDGPLEILSNDSEDCAEDLAGNVSSGEERDSAHESEQIETSPESSPSQDTDRGPAESPPGGLFTNVRMEPSKPAPRTLFGEVNGPQIPTFAPPKKQQGSPRSPSPMRKPPRQAMLARSPERSFSAPAMPRDLIGRKRQDYEQSPSAAQSIQAQQDEAEAARKRREQEMRAAEQTRQAESQELQDDEDELLRGELAKPAVASVHLDAFLPIASGKHLQEMGAVRSDVPSQIEILYRDINSMLVTIGINAKALSSYLMYQSAQQVKPTWTDSLAWESATDVSRDQWSLGDIETLSEGAAYIEDRLSQAEVFEVTQKLDACQTLLNVDIIELRGRITQLRRSTKERAQNGQPEHVSLSMEQMAVQQDLRRATAAFLTRLGQVEDDLVVLQAKLSDMGLSEAEKGIMWTTSKRPSVEAVMSTVNKMTSMAEKRSADVDVLEAQLRKLKMVSGTTDRPRTPDRGVQAVEAVTPDSVENNSVYQTPKSNGARSTAGTPSRTGGQSSIAADGTQWHQKVQRKKQVSRLLKDVLRSKHSS